MSPEQTVVVILVLAILLVIGAYWLGRESAGAQYVPVGNTNSDPWRPVDHVR